MVFCYVGGDIITYTGRTLKTSELTRKIQIFCEMLTGRKFFPHQAQFSRRIIEGVLLNDPDTITSLMSRQSGKSFTVSATLSGLMVILPVFANMPLFADDARLQPFKNGIMMGVFAPTLAQARIIFNNIKDFLSSKRAIEILESDEFNITKDTFNGERVTIVFNNLGVKSSITCFSASDGSNIEGGSYHLYVCDEAQDISNYKYRKSIFPTVSFYNGTKILIGTPSIKKNFFYDAIELNKKEYENGKKKRNHFEYNYETIIKYNPKYAKTVEAAKKIMGENSVEFEMNYCVAPETEILTADLRWVRADSIKVGDKLLGFDEEKPGKYGQRKYREAIVEDVGEIERPCYEVTFEDGTKVTCSEEHQWLVMTPGRLTRWRKTKDLKLTDRAYKILNKWEMPKSDYDLGYLAAAFDGEGNVGHTDGRLQQLCFAQRDNAMLKHVKECLDKYGFEYSYYTSPIYAERNQDDVYRLIITGGKRETLKFLGMVRPKRLLENLDVNTLGTLRCSNGELGRDIHPHVTSVKFVGNRKVIPIRTSTHTFIAEGLASHNCLKWVFQFGMFIDGELFTTDPVADSTLDRMDYCKDQVCIAGIDVGKSQDSTVVTIGIPNYESPVVLEKATEYDAEDYVLYDIKIIDWLEIVGDNYEEQFYKVKDYLNRFNIKLCVIDGSGVGSPVADRLAANVDFPVIPFVFTPASKSMLMKNFSAYLNNKCFHYPSSSSAQDTIEYRKFQEQCLELTKDYRGDKLVVAAPKERNKHDDYPFSAALMVWGLKHDVGEVEVVDNNEFIQTTKRNIFVGRRNHRIRW